MKATIKSIPVTEVIESKIAGKGHGLRDVFAQLVLQQKTMYTEREMNIQPTYVTFEQAKLLKEKGFNKLVRQHYKQYPTDNLERVERIYSGALYDWNSKEAQEGWNGIVTSAPEQWQVVEWLRVNHGIFIGLELVDNTKEFYYQPNVWTMKDKEYHDEDMINQAKMICKWKEWQFNSPQEAYLAAFDYILNNLI